MILFDGLVFLISVWRLCNINNGLLWQTDWTPILLDNLQIWASHIKIQSWSWSFLLPQVGLVCIMLKSFHFLMFMPLVFSRSIICSLRSSDHQTWLDLQSHSWTQLLLHSNNRKSAVCLISQELPPSRCYTIITVKVLVRTDHSVCSDISIHTVMQSLSVDVHQSEQTWLIRQSTCTWPYPKRAMGYARPGGYFN